MAMTRVHVPDDARSITDAAFTTPGPVKTKWANRTFAIARISLGWIFLWAFLDKAFGLGFATENSDSWINGGSPTNGFLEFGTKGPLAGFYQSFAGALWADWLFMIALAGIGIALMLGIGMRIAAVAGAALLIMMWSAVLAPANNPFMDDHLIYATVLVGLALINSGDTWGLGQIWKKLPIVQKYPVLK